jgi:choline dehydrogenase
LCLKISQTSPLAELSDPGSKHPAVDHVLYEKSDAELEKIVRERVETLYHPTSTCRMAPRAEKGVVDSHLRVYGIQGLRVCDASVFPSIISGHPVSFLNLWQT